MNDRNILKIVTIVGARPQFVKAAALSKAFSTCFNIQEIMVHTGQHFDTGMSEIFFTELQIPKPHYNLNINGGTHGHMTGRMLAGIEDILNKEQPDAVLVYGDTNSTFAGALAAAKLHIPVCHIEAGLRSFNKEMPEEINRVLTDHVSHLLFCPTFTAVENLHREGIIRGVHHVGDVMYDVVLQIVPIAKKKSTIVQQLRLKEKEYALATIHRAENTRSFEELQVLINYIHSESTKLNLQIVLPLHPRTQAFCMQHKVDFKNIITCNPLGYLDIQRLLHSAHLVFTDSGGLQKEAYFHQVPCITLRNETEWVETIEAGWNRLWQHNSEFSNSRTPIIEYGNGEAAHNIVQKLIETFKIYINN